MKHLFVLLAILPLISSAQKIQLREVDKFNGVKSAYTKTEALDRILGSTTFSVKGLVSTKDLSRSFTLYFTYTTSVTCSLTGKDRAVFLFADGSKITLPYAGDYKIYTRNSYVNFYVNPSLDELTKMTTDEITDIRLETSDYNADFAIKGKYRSVIPGIAKLLIAEQ